MLIKTPPLFFMCLSSVLFLCSCDKHKLLMAERDQVESETKRMLEETKSVDSKFFSLGEQATTTSVKLQMHNRDLAHQNTLMEQELATLSKKCSEGEEMVKALRPRLETYKAKFVR